MVREDPERRGLLYAGTETGIHVSFDDGMQWQPLQLDLPVVPITDLTIRDNDLVAATQGRAFWILDDLSPLQQISDEVVAAGTHLFAPSPARRISGGGFSLPRSNLGKNPRDGVILQYTLPEELTADSEEELTLEILDSEGTVLRRVSNRPSGPPPPPNPFFQIPPDVLPTKQGMNQYVWNMRRDDLVQVPGLFSFGPLQGPLVAPGDYHARLTFEEAVMTQEVGVVPDPRSEATAEDYAAQQTMIQAIAERVNEVNQTVLDLRQVKSGVETALGRVANHEAAESFTEAGSAVVDAIEALEAELVQVKSQTFQDIINFPNMLNMDYMDLMGKVDGMAPPINQGMTRRLGDLETRWTGYQAERDRILDEALVAFNDLFAEHDVPAVQEPEEPEPEIEAGEKPKG